MPRAHPDSNRSSVERGHWVCPSSRCVLKPPAPLRCHERTRAARQGLPAVATLVSLAFPPLLPLAKDDNLQFLCASPAALNKGAGAVMLQQFNST